MSALLRLRSTRGATLYHPGSIVWHEYHVSRKKQPALHLCHGRAANSREQLTLQSRMIGLPVAATQVAISRRI